MRLMRNWYKVNARLISNLFMSAEILWFQQTFYLYSLIRKFNYCAYNPEQARRSELPSHALRSMRSSRSSRPTQKQYCTSVLKRAKSDTRAETILHQCQKTSKTTTLICPVFVFIDENRPRFHWKCTALSVLRKLGELKKLQARNAAWSLVNSRMRRDSNSR